MADLFNLPGFSLFIQEKKMAIYKNKFFVSPQKDQFLFSEPKKLELNNMYNRSRCSHYGVAWCFEQGDSTGKINALIHLLQCVQPLLLNTIYFILNTIYSPTLHHSCECREI